MCARVCVRVCACARVCVRVCACVCVAMTGLVEWRVVTQRVRDVCCVSAFCILGSDRVLSRPFVLLQFIKQGYILAPTCLFLGEGWWGV